MKSLVCFDTCVPPRVRVARCSGQASISAQGLDLLNGLLALDPAKRTSAAEALGHAWFTTEKPAPTPLEEMPQARVEALDDYAFLV